MHGLVFVQLQHYVKEKFGDVAWKDVLKVAEINPHRIYVMLQSYPDEEIEKLISSAGSKFAISREVLLEDFGKYMGNYLIRTYQVMIDSSWKTLEFLENTESCIHQVIKSSGSLALPPELICKRISADEVLIVYSSPRKMCALAKGIIQSVADHYKQNVNISHPTCMIRDGASHCEMYVRIYESKFIRNII